MQSFFASVVTQLSASDFFVSLPFWGVFVLVAALLRLTPSGTVLKSGLMLACSIGMLLMLPRITPPILLVFAGLCVLSYAVGSLLNGPRLADVRARRAVSAAGIAGVVLVLAFFKYRFLQEAVLSQARTGFRASDVIFLIGISYSSFKAIHFIIEGYKKAIKKGTFLDFLNYMFFFPSFISGPINRFSHFVEHSALTRTTSIKDDLGPGLERIVHGLFKKTVLTTIVLPYTITSLSTPLETMPFWQMVGGLYAFALYSYFDFSGYTDLALGSARLMGFVLPENFDLPFLKRNIQQLWAHWHISLSSWLTDYVYWPLVRRMRKSNTLRAYPLLISNIAILITFLVCGLWHGEGFHFVLWGLYQGIGIATVNVYQNWKRRVRDERALRYFRSRASYAAGVFGTFNFFAAGMLLFVLDGPQIGAVLQRLLPW